MLWNRRVVMRDGVEVAADVVLPAGEPPWPAVVNRTPYMRGRNLRTQSWLRLVDADYAFVSVDVRGRGDSDGHFTPWIHDADDGHDTVEWVAAQPWCTGRVGMVGGSYEGLTQWWSAKGRPPHLCCIVPKCVGAASIGSRWSYDTGVPVQYWLWWFNLVTGRTVQHAGAPSWEANFGHLPLRTLHEQVGTARKWWTKYVDGEIDMLGPGCVLTADDWNRFDVPALVGVGWWDDQSTMNTWIALKNSPAGSSSRLLIGAWDHAGNLGPRPVLGGLDVSESAIDVIDYMQRFLAVHLKGERAAVEELPRCRVFRTGQMRWEALDDWPSPNAEPLRWHLHANGALARAIAEENSEDRYLYDPANPVRDFSNLDQFAWSDPPLDCRYLLRREDVLVYTSAALESQLDVSGRAFFEGFISADCPDTDVAVTLYDVYPDGRSILLGLMDPPAMLRLAYRHGADPTPLTAGEPASVTIPITWLHHSFLPGHRIRLAITSSWYPACARNLNRGEPWADATKSRAARVAVHRGPRYLSRLILPVEPKAGAR